MTDIERRRQVQRMQNYIATTYGGPHTVNYGSGPLVVANDGTLVTPNHLCPDLLRYENIGAADCLRGRVVRAFFWLLRAWPP